MRNQTGKPYASKELTEEGEWVIHFKPCLKMDGTYHYTALRGHCCETEIDMIVGLLNKYAKASIQ
jgi:hypothetical protein